MIVERLREFGARLRRRHVGRGPLAAQILRNHQQHALFAGRAFLRAAGVDAHLRSLVAAPQSEIEDRRVDADAGLKHLERPHVLGEAGKREADRGMQIERLTVSETLPLACGRSAERATCRSCSALRNFEVGQNHLRILLQRQVRRHP